MLGRILNKIIFIYIFLANDIHTSKSHFWKGQKLYRYVYNQDKLEYHSSQIINSMQSSHTITSAYLNNSATTGDEYSKGIV